MKHTVPHHLGKDVAKKAVLAAFASYAERFAKYQPTSTWVTDDRAEISFTAKGITLRGALAILPASIEMDLDIPFLLRPFKDKALGAVEREITTWVGKAERGEL
jgi:Putative polyhydroxyalkanoic acid system protein (PHA_gran_rgn)